MSSRYPVKGRKRRKSQANIVKKLTILRKSKAIRQWLLRNPWVRPMCVFNYAAIKIQQHLRGFLARRRDRRNSSIKGDSRKSRKSVDNRQLDRYLTFLDKVRYHGRTKPEWLDEGYSSWCAVRIQASWRMHRIYRRHQLSSRLVNQVASIIIQTAWRNKQYRSRTATAEAAAKRSPILLDTFVAVQIIQLCWRSFCNRRIYKYFKDLIVHKLKGAPHDLLKSIIPSEAHALDRASGVHVRFRLGGKVFPPKIYFKIYTHRPLCDVNSFAPRNYALERPMDAKQITDRSDTLVPRDKHFPAIRVGGRYFGAVVKTTSVNGTSDWYRRDECNDWRPIASHMFESVATPPWFREIPHISKPKHFHYSKAFREELLKKYRKKRRRQWMVKAFVLSTQQQQNNVSSGVVPPKWAPISQRDEKKVEYDDVLDGEESRPDTRPDAREQISQVDQRFSPKYTDSSSRGSMISQLLKADPKDKSTVSSAAFDFKSGFGSSFGLGVRNETKGMSGGGGASTVTKKRISLQNNFPGAPTMSNDFGVDLVDWSLALNFDDYTRKWDLIGTSLPSDAKDTKYK